MPRGIYIRTEKHNKKISEALKGKHNSYKTEFKKGYKINLGKKLSEETKKKISIANSFALKGRILSEETRKKIGIGNKGKKYSENVKLKMSKSQKGNKNALGHKVSKEARGKMSISHLGQTHHRHTEESKQKLREATIRQLLSNRMPIKNTKIELAIGKELKKLNLNYERQVVLCKIGIVDFLLSNYDIIIECYGDYWHNLLERKRKDATKNLIYSFNGYKVFIFWEHEINKSPKKCINKILRYIKKARLL